MVHRNILLSDYLFPNSTSTPRERELSGLLVFLQFLTRHVFPQSNQLKFAQKGVGAGGLEPPPFIKTLFLENLRPPFAVQGMFLFL